MSNANPLAMSAEEIIAHLITSDCRGMEYKKLMLLRVITSAKLSGDVFRLLTTTEKK